MTDKPIIFSAPMIRTLLDGRKTQTRRVLKPQPPTWAYQDRQPGYSCMTPPGHIEFRGFYIGPDGVDRGPAAKFIKLPYAPGDRLWVRETWRPALSADDPWHVAVAYQADGQVKHWNWSSDADFGDWNMPKQAAKGNVPGIHMPRWASRLTLVVTDVRVQRVQDISNADAIDEGVQPNGNAAPPIDQFRDIWNRLYGPDAWGHNGWVVALTFDVHKCNIDQMK